MSWLVFFLLPPLWGWFHFLGFWPKCLGICLRGNPFAQGNQGYIISILMLMIDGYIVLLGFNSQDNYSSRDRKGYGSFLSMIDSTAIALIQILSKIWNRADMTSLLIGLGLSDCPSSSVRAKVEYCKSRDLFDCQVVDCSATRILSSSIMGHYTWPTGSLIGSCVCVGREREWESLIPLQRCSWLMLQSQPTGCRIFWSWKVLNSYSRIFI